jgi:thiol:disulfide interchange protein DsbC
MKRLILLALAAFSLSACAEGPAPATTVAGSPDGQATAPTAGAQKHAAGTPEARVHAALRKLDPKIQVERIAPSRLPGFHEAIVGGQVVYVSDDGRYLLQGVAYDIEAKKNLGEESMAALRRELLKTVPHSERIVFAPPNPKYTVVVFTDVECGFCRKFHNEIAEYNRQGIAVEYLAFPRMGMGSEDFRTMISVWCAADPRKAMTDAKNDRRVPRKDCKNPVAAHFHLGQRIGLAGTPMILAEDGTQLGGYVSPAELRAKLDKLAGEDAQTAAATGT